MTTVSIYVATFNCGRAYVDKDAFASQLFSGLTKPQLPDLVVLALEEVAPIAHSFIGGSFIAPYLALFNHAVQKAIKQISGNATTYTQVAAKNLGMTAIMVFSKDQTAVRSIETGGVGVGFLEMGNKGAVGVRLTYGRESGVSTELTFLAAHLAAMEWELERRNRDWQSIVQGVVFSSSIPVQRNQANRDFDEGEESADEILPLLSISPRDASVYKPTAHLILAGDLNYRTSTLRPSPEHAKNFPQPYDSPTESLKSLFSNDQLTQERAASRTCHGLSEAEVTFPPTYKYKPIGPFQTPDEDLAKWHWATHRWPSWTDRILYLDFPTWMKLRHPQAQISTGRYTALPLLATSDHRPVTLEIEVPLIPIKDPPLHEATTDFTDPRVTPPFRIDIDWRSRRAQARRFEVIVGVFMFFTTTWDGGAIVLALLAGSIGGYFAIRTFLE